MLYLIFKHEVKGDVLFELAQRLISDFSLDHYTLLQASGAKVIKSFVQSVIDYAALDDKTINKQVYLSASNHVFIFQRFDEDENTINKLLMPNTTIKTYPLEENGKLIGWYFSTTEISYHTSKPEALYTLC